MSEYESVNSWLSSNNMGVLSSNKKNASIISENWIESPLNKCKMIIDMSESCNIMVGIPISKKYVKTVEKIFNEDSIPYIDNISIYKYIDGEREKYIIYLECYNEYTNVENDVDGVIETIKGMISSIKHSIWFIEYNLNLKIIEKSDYTSEKYINGFLDSKLYNTEEYIKQIKIERYDN